MTRCRLPRTSTPPWSRWTRRPRATPTSTRGRPRSSSSTRTAWSASDRRTSGGAGVFPAPPPRAGQPKRVSEGDPRAVRRDEGHPRAVRRDEDDPRAVRRDEDDPRAVRRDDLGGGRAVPSSLADRGPVAGLVDRVGLIRRPSALQQLGVFELRMRGVGELVELPRDQEGHLLGDVHRVVTDPLDLARYDIHPDPPL